MSRADFEFVTMPPPHDTSEWVKLRIRILWTKTGEMRDYLDEGLWDDDNKQPCLYIWEEGNFACDCNRHLFFARSQGHEAAATSCGDGEYLVNIYSSLGKLCHQEFDEITKQRVES